MKKITLLAMAFTAFAFTACQQEDLLAENDKAKNELDTTTDGIQVVDGYLSFASNDLFQSYLASLKNEQSSSTISTRATQQSIKGFTSINSLKEQVAVANTRSGDSEEGTEDEYRISIAEDLIKDELLYNVMDTTLRISIGDMFYKITEQGTFYCPKEYAEEIDNVIKTFDATKVSSISDDLYAINDKFYFSDTFGVVSGEENVIDMEATEIIEEENSVATRGAAFGESNYNTSYYGLNTYKWKNKTVVGKFLSWLLGKDVSREKGFDSTHRVQCELFQVNYVFYASTGFKVKMQKRKKIWFIKYWVSTGADDIVIGVERLSGKMNFNYNPGTVYNYGTFTSTWQGIVNNMVYGGLSKPTFIEDFVTDRVTTIFPGIKEFNFLKWKIDPWSWNQNLTKDAIYSGLNSLTGKVANAVGGKLAKEDPRLAMVMAKRGEADMHFMGGARSFGKGSSKTIRFSQSGGFSFKLGGSVVGYIPEKFAITEAQIWGAIKYNGRWRGIRFTHSE